MAAVNGVSEGDKGGPPPPSPLTGCYLLIVIGEPHSKEHKDIILQRIAKGLLSWDVNDCLVDLEKELAIITEQSPEGEEARYGERLIQFASENLVTEVLIHPVVSTLAQCVRNLLSSFTRHRHIIHSGYTFAANGSWILQDGTFSLADFSEAFQELEVQRVIRAYENGISMDIHCSPEGDWNSLPKESFARYCKVRINPNDVLTSGSPSISSFVDYISPFLIPAEIETLLESSDVVGNIRFSHPTLYVFPGGQGDAALFGINGFNMLLDGGFSRKSCFWDFVRHLDRLDAVLLTRLNNSNVNGIGAVLRRKRQNAVYPQIGHFFCNIPEKKAVLSPDGDKDKDPLLVNILEEGQELISNLQHLSLPPQSCYRDSEPINLYHKVGHGTLDMYVLSPAKDSREVREFMHKWNNNDQKLFAYPKNNKDFVFPVQNLVSICALLVWQPANPEDNITRILYPGSTPQHKIFEGLDKIKHLGFIKHPVCSENSLTPSISATALKAKSIIDRIVPEQKPTKRLFENKQKEKPAKENKLIENGDTTDLIEKQIKKSESTDGDKIAPKVQKPKKLDTEKEVIEKTEEKPKTKPKDEPKVKVDIKPKQRSDSQQRKPKVPEKKASPTTPKKTIESKVNGEAPKSKPVSKASPQATPAKSAKEASNRRVVESKYKQTHKPPPKPAPEKKERKPVTRKAKEVTPSAKAPTSPLKKVNGVAKPEIITRKARLDKEGTTDSSTVSTPSADPESLQKKDISKLTPEEIEKLKAQELADLKEEQEVVKEIEAVFRKGEIEKDKFSDMRKIKDISVEEKEKEEYLIIEKEEIVQVKEDETQKLTRDSEESEKQKPAVQEEVVAAKEAEPDAETKEKVVTSKEGSIGSPEDKVDTSSERKTNDRDVEELNKEVVESQPDEKVSGNVESGATTTAPTLPEDERIPLDEIKEDNGDQAIEEKYIKEETKEKEVLPVIQLPPKPFEAIPKLPPVVGIRLDKHTNIRDLVKTPDEVADLPVHEEVDIHNYEEYRAVESAKELAQYGKYDEKEKGDEPKLDDGLNKNEPLKEKQSINASKEAEAKTEIKNAEEPIVKVEPKQEVLKEYKEEAVKLSEPAVKEELAIKEDDQKAKTDVVETEEIKKAVEDLEELKKTEKVEHVVKEELKQLSKEEEPKQITLEKDLKENNKEEKLDKKPEEIAVQQISSEEESDKDVKESAVEVKLGKIAEKGKLDTKPEDLVAQQINSKEEFKKDAKEIVEEAKLDITTEELTAKQESIQITKKEESKEITKEENLKEGSKDELEAKHEPIQIDLKEEFKKATEIEEMLDIKIEETASKKESSEIIKEEESSKITKEDIKEIIPETKLDKKAEEAATKEGFEEDLKTSAPITQHIIIHDSTIVIDTADNKEFATIKDKETQPLLENDVLKDGEKAQKDDFEEAAKFQDLPSQKDTLVEEVQQQFKENEKEQQIINQEGIDVAIKPKQITIEKEILEYGQLPSEVETDLIKDGSKKDDAVKDIEKKIQLEADEKEKLIKAGESKEIQQKKVEEEKKVDTLTETDIKDDKIQLEDQLLEKSDEKQEEAIAKHHKPSAIDITAEEVLMDINVTQEKDEVAKTEDKQISKDEVTKTILEKTAEKEIHEALSADKATTEDKTILKKEETELTSQDYIKEADITNVSKKISENIITVKDEIIPPPTYSRVTKEDEDTQFKLLDAAEKTTVKEVTPASIEQEIAFKENTTKESEPKVSQHDIFDVIEKHELLTAEEKEPILQKPEQQKRTDDTIIVKETSVVKEEKLTEKEPAVKAEPEMPSQEVIEKAYEIFESSPKESETKECAIAKVELEKQETNIDLKATPEAVKDIFKPTTETKDEAKILDSLPALSADQQPKTETDKIDISKEELYTIPEFNATSEQKQLEKDDTKLTKQALIQEAEASIFEKTEQQDVYVSTDNAEVALDKSCKFGKEFFIEANKEGENPEIKDVVAPETKPASEVVSGILEIKGVTEEKKSSEKEVERKAVHDKFAEGVEQLEEETTDEKFVSDFKQLEKSDADAKYAEDVKKTGKEDFDEKLFKDDKGSKNMEVQESFGIDSRVDKELTNDFTEQEKFEVAEKFSEGAKQLDKENVDDKFAKDSKQTDKVEVDGKLDKDVKQPEKKEFAEKLVDDRKHIERDADHEKFIEDAKQPEKDEVDEKSCIDNKYSEKDIIDEKLVKDFEQEKNKEEEEKIVKDVKQLKQEKTSEKYAEDAKQSEREDVDKTLLKDDIYLEQEQADGKFAKDVKELEKEMVSEKVSKDDKHSEKKEIDEKFEKQPEKVDVDEKLVKDIKQLEKETTSEMLAKHIDQQEKTKADEFTNESPFEQTTVGEPSFNVYDNNTTDILTDIQDRKHSVTEEDEKLIVKSVLQNTQQVAEVDKKLQELKSKVGEMSDVTQAETKPVTAEAKDGPVLKSVELIEKIDLGSKSPKEREQDVAIIVATVAEVLKSDAPLEELEEKVIIPSISSFTTYTTQLRETHITTQDSVPSDVLIKEEQESDFDTKISATSEFLEQERKIKTDSTVVEKNSNLIENSKNLMQETSKLIADIKSSKVEGVSLEKTESTESGLVHRMLVTASSEDGGEETVICPAGSIVFSRSSESSGRSSPDIQSDSVSTVKTSIDLKEPESGVKKAESEIKKESEVTQSQQLQEIEREVKNIVETAEKVISEKAVADTVDDKKGLKDDNAKGQELLEEKKESDSIYKELEKAMEKSAERVVEEVSKVAGGEGFIETGVTNDNETKEKHLEEAAKDEKQKIGAFETVDIRKEFAKDQQSIEGPSIDTKSEPSITEIAKDLKPKTHEISVDEPKQVKDEIIDGNIKVKEFVDSGKDQIGEEVFDIVKKEETIKTQMEPALSSQLTEEDKSATGGKLQEKQDSLVQEKFKFSADTKETTKHEAPEDLLQSQQALDATITAPQKFADEKSEENEVKSHESGVLLKEEKEAELSKTDTKLPVISPPVNGSEEKVEKEGEIVTEGLKETRTVETKISEPLPATPIANTDQGKEKCDVGKTQDLFALPKVVQEKQQLQKEGELFKSDAKFDAKEIGVSKIAESTETFLEKEKLSYSNFSVEHKVELTQEDKTLTLSQKDDSKGKHEGHDVMKAEISESKKKEKEKLGESVSLKTMGDTEEKDGKETKEEKIILTKELEDSSFTTSIHIQSKVDEKTELVSGIKEKDEKISEVLVSEPETAVQKDKKEEKTEDVSLASELSDSAGPSRRKDSLVSHLSPSKTSTEDLNLSGKSTPDIADVERMREMQEILKHEKHIPGSCTPPTVPVSPVVKDEGDSTKVDVKKSTETSPLSSIKDTDVRSITPASDDYERSDISSGQVSRAAHLLEAERNDSEEDYPGSPNSITSQLAHSHSTLQYEFEESIKLQSSTDPMNTSFYGSLPDDPLHKDSGHFMDEADMDFEKAMHEHRQARGEDLGRETSSSYLFEVTKAKYGASGSSGPSSVHEEFDSLMTASFIGELPSGQMETEDTLKKWGKPLGLPSPAPPNDNKGTPKKERKLPPHVTAKNKINDDRKRAESPSKNKLKKSNAVYVDLTYVPHHGNSNYSYVDFFKRVRARYYVFSGIEPSKEVYNALLEAKQTWEDKDLEVTIIPTYDTDILGYWVAENEDLLAKYKIDLSPSASRCTINLQDHETSCSAYRLEF